MKRGIIIVLLLNLVLVAVLVAGVLVVRRGLGALAENQEKLVLLEQKKKELGELRRLFDETREERTAIDAYFVSGNAFPVFIEQLEGLASSTTVALDISAAAIIGEVEKEKDKTKINAPRFQLHMTVMARFADLFRFLSLVELILFGHFLT